MPLVCVLLTQCGDWNTSLLAPIREAIAEQGSIKEIRVTTYPNIVKFNKDALAVWGDPRWENQYGLVISGTSLANETRVLAPAEYTISPLNTAEPGVQTVTVTLNDTHLYPSVTTSFYILIADGNDFLTHEVIYNGTTLGSLSDAIKKAAGTSDNPSVVYVVADVITIADPLTISNGNIILTVLGNATIRRGSANGSLFTIESGASLTLDTGNGSSLTLDGNHVPANAPLITVSSGTLTMRGKVILQNNTNGSVIYGSSNNFMINASMSGGNGYERAGGVSVTNGGIFIMEGGVISGNRTSNTGGGVFVGEGGKFEMSGAAVISGNEAATSGGGVSVDSGTFTMKGGTISGNTADKGDGVYVASGNSTTFTMSGSTVVQEVYLESGSSPAKITVSGPLTLPEGGVSAYITLADDASSGASVLAGSSLTAEDIKKFKLSDSGAFLVHNNNNQGILARPRPGEDDNTFYLSSDGTLQSASTLNAAINGVSGGTAPDDPALIYVAKNVTLAINDNITIEAKHIKLTANGEDKTIERGNGNSGSLFTVSGTGASLTLDGGNGTLTLDGGWNNLNQSGITANAPLVMVSGGKLTMGDGVMLQNNKNNKSDNSAGGIDVENGTFIMTGGTISGNIAVSGKGGGVRIGGSTAKPSFEMSGGTISGNWSIRNDWGGGGVFVDGEGTFDMSGGEISGNTATNGGGVFQWNGEFKMRDNAVIRGNTAYNRGGGVCQWYSQWTDGGVFTMTGGIIHGKDEDDRPNTATNGGAAYYRNGDGTPPTGWSQSVDATIVNGRLQWL
jgi:hypothetical protein